MVGITGSNAPQHASRVFQTYGGDPQAKIRFENTLAAHAAAGKQPEEAVQSVLDMNSMPDTPSPIEGRPQANLRRPIPSQKVLESLNHLVNQNHMEQGSGLDIHR